MQIDDGKEQTLRLSNGPIDNSLRSCSNFICLFIFIGYCFGLIGILIYSNKIGNVDRVSRGYDSDQRPCGVDQLVEYPYIYFANPSQLSQTVCVKSCPTLSTTQSLIQYHHLTTLACSTNSVIKDCNSAQIYDSKIFDNRACVPTDKAIYKQIYPGLSMGFIQQLLTDIQAAKISIILFVALAFIITLLNYILLRWCTSTVIWGIIIAIIALTTLFGYYSYTQYQLAQQYIGYSIRGYLITALICWIIAIVTVILVICFYKRIRLSTAIIKSAADFVNYNQYIVVVPLISFVLSIILLVFFIQLGIMLYSTGQPEENKAFGSIGFNLIQKLMSIYLLFGIFWVFSILIAGNNFIISGVVSIWYWQQGESGQEHLRPIPDSAFRLFRYHFGTIVIGGFLLGLVSFFRVIFEYLYRNAEYLKNSPNLRFLFQCCTCCIWCFERFLQYINQNIYIQTNLTGESFFKAAKRALDIMTNNQSIIMTVVGLGDLLNNITRLMITLFISAFFYQSIIQYPSILFGQVVVDQYNPTIVVAFASFIIASLFTSVYGVSIEGILHLFCIDEEVQRMKDPHQGAKMCPAALRQFISEQVYNQS